MSRAVRMNAKGIRAVLNHPAVVADIDARGARMAAAAGEGVEARKRHRRVNRYGNTIRTVSETGRKRQAEENVLIKSIEAGR